MEFIRMKGVFKAPGLGGLMLLGALTVSGSVSASPSEEEADFLQYWKPLPVSQSVLHQRRQRSRSLDQMPESPPLTHQRSSSLVYRLPEKEESHPLNALNPLQSLENVYGFFVRYFEIGGAAVLGKEIA